MSDVLNENTENEVVEQPVEGNETEHETGVTTGSDENSGDNSEYTGTTNEEETSPSDTVGGELDDLTIPIPGTSTNQEGIKYSIALKPIDNIKLLLKEIGYTDTFLKAVEESYPKFNGMPSSAPANEIFRRGFYDMIVVEEFAPGEFDGYPEYEKYSANLKLTFPNEVRKLIANLDDLFIMEETIPPLTHESDPSHIVYDGFEGFSVTHSFNIVDFLHEANIERVTIPDHEIFDNGINDYKINFEKDKQYLTEAINKELSKIKLNGWTQNEGGVFRQENKMGFYITDNNAFLNNRADDTTTVFPCYKVQMPTFGEYERKLNYGFNKITVKPLPNHYFNLVAKDSVLNVVKKLDLDKQEVRRIVGFKPIFAGEEYNNIPNVDNGNHFKPYFAKELPVTFFDINDDVVVTESDVRKLNEGRIFVTLINEQYNGDRIEFFKKLLPYVTRKTGEDGRTISEFNYDIIDKYPLITRSGDLIIGDYFSDDALETLKTRLNVPYVDFNMVWLNESIFRKEIAMSPDTAKGLEEEDLYEYVKEEGRAVTGHGGFPIIPIDLTTYPKLISDHITNNREVYVGTSLEGLGVSVSEISIEQDNVSNPINKSVSVLTLSGTSIKDKDSAIQALNEFFEYFNSKHYLDAYTSRDNNVINVRGPNGYNSEHVVTVDAEGEDFVQSLVTDRKDSHFSGGEFIVRVSYAPEKITLKKNTVSFNDDGSGRVVF